MHAEPIIRRARPGDEAGIHESHMRSIREVCVKDHGEEEIRGWGYRQLGKRWIDPIRSAHVWVVEHRGAIHGHAYLHMTPTGDQMKAHIHGLYLTPEILGKGFGFRLANLMLEAAKSAGAKQVTLESTITAHDFYRRLGFVDAGPLIKVDIGGFPVTAFPMVFHFDRATPTSTEIARRIKFRAQELGFDLVGITSADPIHYRDYFRQWLDDGQAGSMAYMGKRFEERVDPRVYLPGAASIICVALNYYAPLAGKPDAEHGRIARYALGGDYHELIKDRLHRLADFIREIAPEARTRPAVDTAPVMEREIAARAGIGWVGKNTCIIHPRVGSWIFLGEVLTTLALPADEPITDHCGSCTRCIDACPTQAITAPYQLDARRCISYLTIEHRDDIAPELHQKIGDWLYGCDVCQDVCPHNRQPPVAIDPALQPRFPTGSLNTADVLQWTQETYREKLAGSAMKRVKLPMLQRNARIVNSNAQRR